MAPNMIPKAIFLFLFFLSMDSAALSFSRNGGTFVMEGVITSGDSKKFKRELLNWKEPPRVFLIDSPGGDLIEAMEIGLLIRSYQIPVWAQGQCASACVYIYVAGVERKLFGYNSKIGLHRPTIVKEQLSQLNQLEAERAYAHTLNLSKAFLIKMGLDDNSINRIHSISSGSVEWLDTTNTDAMFGFRIPFYEEWLASKCGRVSDNKMDQAVLMAMQSWAMVTELKESGFPIENLHENILRSANLAAEQHESDLFKVSMRRIKNIDKCEERASDAFVIPFHRLWKRSFQEGAQRIDKRT